ncbi:hypothetical protein [Kribbella sp. DT2]|uniref:hypothetical protein n=1 Tax=Kribbella sp. DT2 TaxID=3393427 RepID=UPI003CED60CD
MSNQQPPYQGRPPQQPPYQGPPPQGQPPYQGPPQGQPPYQGQPPQQPPYQQGPPPQQQRPPYQGPPQGQPPYQGPPQGQPPYQQGQPPYGPPPQQQRPPYQQGPPQQPPYQQGPPPQFQQQQYPPQQQWGPQGQQQFGPHGGRGQGSKKFLVLAGGALAVVVVIGVVLSLVFGRNDDNNVQPDPNPQPTGQPSENADKGIEVGEGVFVDPAAGYLRKTLEGFKGVYLLKQGEGYFMVQTVKAGSDTADTVLPVLIASEKKARPTGFKAQAVKKDTPGADDKSPVKQISTQAFQSTATGQGGSFGVIGFIGVIERNDGIMTVVQVYGRQDKAATLQPDSTAMLKSVVASQ